MQDADSEEDGCRNRLMQSDPTPLVGVAASLGFSASPYTPGCLAGVDLAQSIRGNASSGSGGGGSSSSQVGLDSSGTWKSGKSNSGGGAGTSSPSSTALAGAAAVPWRETEDWPRPPAAPLTFQEPASFVWMDAAVPCAPTWAAPDLPAVLAAGGEEVPTAPTWVPKLPAALAAEVEEVSELPASVAALPPASAAAPSSPPRSLGAEGAAALWIPHLRGQHPCGGPAATAAAAPGAAGAARLLVAETVEAGPAPLATEAASASVHLCNAGGIVLDGGPSAPPPGAAFAGSSPSSNGHIPTAAPPEVPMLQRISPLPSRPAPAWSSASCCGGAAAAQLAPKAAHAREAWDGDPGSGAESGSSEASEQGGAACSGRLRKPTRRGGRRARHRKLAALARQAEDPAAVLLAAADSRADDAATSADAWSVPQTSGACGAQAAAAAGPVLPGQPPRSPPGTETVRRGGRPPKKSALAAAAAPIAGPPVGATAAAVAVAAKAGAAGTASSARAADTNGLGLHVGATGSVAAWAAVQGAPPPPGGPGLGGSPAWPVDAEEVQAGEVIGKRVLIRGLVRQPEYNGEWGRVEAYDPEMQRYLVSLLGMHSEGQQPVFAKLRRENLVVPPTLRLQFEKEDGARRVAEDSAGGSLAQGVAAVGLRGPQGPMAEPLHEPPAALRINNSAVVDPMRTYAYIQGSALDFEDSIAGALLRGEPLDVHLDEPAPACTSQGNPSSERHGFAWGVAPRREMPPALGTAMDFEDSVAGSLVFATPRPSPTTGEEPMMAKLSSGSPAARRMANRNLFARSLDATAWMAPPGPAAEFEDSVGAVLACATPIARRVTNMSLFAQAAVRAAEVGSAEEEAVARRTAPGPASDFEDSMAGPLMSAVNTSPQLDEGPSVEALASNAPKSRVPHWEADRYVFPDTCEAWDGWPPEGPMKVSCRTGTPATSAKASFDGHPLAGDHQAQDPAPVAPALQQPTSAQWRPSLRRTAM